MFLFPAVLGAECFDLVSSCDRDREEVKIRGRETLARELHDMVADHVSAIAVRAQAGQVVGANDAAAALDALAVIEHEASRTLAEMRGIVGWLRGSEILPSHRSQGSATSGDSHTTATCRASRCMSTTASAMSAPRSVRRCTGSHRRP